jgi:hypothetical protein
MSSQSIPLRHIPAEIVAVAQAIASQTGLSLTDVYRLALACGILIEATKITPDRAGTYAGLDGAYLAKALRRHLSSAIDLLTAYGEHPHSHAPAPPAQSASASPLAHPQRPPDEADNPFFGSSISDDLESLGIGLGLSQQSESERVAQEST